MLTNLKRSMAFALAFLLMITAVPVAVKADDETSSINDGTYAVSVEMWNASKDELSMASPTLEDKAKLVVENGDATLYLVFQEAEIMNSTAYLTSLLVYNDYAGDISNTTEGNYISYLDDAQTNVKEVAIPVIAGSEFTYISIYVPLMGQSVNARVYVDYNNLTEYTEEAIDLTAWESAVATYDALTVENYTSESYATVTLIVEETQRLLGLTYTTITQEEIDAQASALIAAIRSDLVLNVADGNYTVDGYIWHATNNAASMANGIIESTQLEITDQSIKVTLNVKQLVVEMYGNTITSYVEKIQYLDGDGYVEADITGNDLEDGNVSQLQFVLPANVEYTTIQLYYNNRWADARLYLDFETLTAVNDDNQDPVTPQPPVSKPSISLDKTALTLYTQGNNTSATLKASTSNATGTVTWSSANTSIATVSSKGVVTAKKAGTTTIKATVNGVSASCKVTVKTASVKLNKTSAVIYTGGVKKVTLKATVAGASTKVTWKSSNTKVATVSSKGVVKAKKAGTVKITATANGISKTCTVKVKKAKLTVKKTSITLKKGKKFTISAKAVPSTTIKYKSNKKKVATVSSKGVIKAKKKGTAKITVSCNGIKKIIKVKVK